MVKNTVIVPVGAKGGFFVQAAAGRRRPRRAARRRHRVLPHVHQRPARHHRQPRRRQGRASARRRAPRRRRSLPRGRGRQGHGDVLRHRELASRSSTASGWATRSRPAARSATTTRAWASPRRARWESVKRHFRALGPRLARREDFTCVGIGDMSGDVFGNGMLLSRAHPPARRVRPPPHLPRPEPGRRDARSRSASACSTLPRSSLGRLRQDADLGRRRRVPAHRSRRSRCRRRCARRSASTGDVEQMTPNELMNAILKAPVDLFWNGGIGTYVKADERNPRRRRRPRQQRASASTAASCAARWWARAATSA